jgi:hypothetical protein
MALSPKLILDISKNNQVDNNLSFDIVKLIKEEQIEDHIDQNIYNYLNKQCTTYQEPNQHDEDRLLQSDIPAGLKSFSKKHSRHDFLHNYDDSCNSSRYNDEQDYAFLPKNIEDFHSSIEEEVKYSCSSKISNSCYTFCQTGQNDTVQDFADEIEPTILDHGQDKIKTTALKIPKSRRKKLSDSIELKLSRKQPRKYLKETNFDEQRVMANVRER